MDYSISDKRLLSLSDRKAISFLLHSMKKVACYHMGICKYVTGFGFLWKTFTRRPEFPLLEVVAVGHHGIHSSLLRKSVDTQTRNIM